MIETSSTAKKVSLIFVNYRSIAYLSRSLRLLREDAFFREAGEVIVVNQDASEQKALQALSEQQGFRLIQRENGGFATGANAGAALATSPCIAFLNPDAHYHSGSFENILRVFEADSQVGLLGATLCDRRGQTERWSSGRLLTLPRLMMHNIFPEALLPDWDAIDWVSGGACFVRKDLFHSLGGFSEDFFLYFEDMDLCARVLQAGYVVRSSQSLQFAHAGGKSFTSKRAQKEHFFDSQKKYFTKHRPFWEQRIYFLLKGIRIW